MIGIAPLRVFVHVASCGNIRDAATRLHRTPSAISMTLKQFETDLGAALFESDRKNRLTKLGEEVFEAARDVLREHDQALERIEAVAAGRHGRLRLASVPSVAAELLPHLLTDFLDTRPGLTVELIDTDSGGVHALVADGTVELGIAAPPKDASDLRFKTLFQDPFRLVCRSDNHLAERRTPLCWSDLAGMRIIGNDAAEAIDAAACRRLIAGSALKARSVISLLALVRAGAGVTLLPRLATVSLAADLIAVPMADPLAVRKVGVILRDGRAPSPVCKAVLARLEQATANILSTGQDMS
ncbi:LysR family transcriptional regulator [Marivita sp.]|uniref:LysR family transcriptional regulator n=1 Tax=Marivita sp. TaxID=2003365 RepID=UPI0025C1CCC0|nr:LysR family transcriptional regulator [Marivita sp.]